MKLFYRLCHLIALWTYVLYGRGRMFGARHVPSQGPVLLVCNHQSFLDPVIVAVPLGREIHFLARESLFQSPTFARLIRTLNAFPVRRAAADVGALKEMLRRLRNGAAVTVFPEATRTTDGRVAKVRPGFVIAARRARCPIVPVAIEGAFDMWPRGRKLPGRHPLFVKYGPPIDPRLLDHLTNEQVAAMMTDRLRRMHNSLRLRIGRQPIDYKCDTPRRYHSEAGEEGAACRAG